MVSWCQDEVQEDGSMSDVFKDQKCVSDLLAWPGIWYVDSDTMQPVFQIQVRRKPADIGASDFEAFVCYSGILSQEIFEM